MRPGCVPSSGCAPRGSASPSGPRPYHPARSPASPSQDLEHRRPGASPRALGARACRRATARGRTADLAHRKRRGLRGPGLHHVPPPASPGGSPWTLLLTFGAQGLFALLGSALGDRFDRRSPCSPTSRLRQASWRSPSRRRLAARDGVRHGHAFRIADLVRLRGGGAEPGRPRGPVAGQRHGRGRPQHRQPRGPILGGVLVAAFAPDSTPEQPQTAGYWVFGASNATLFVRHGLTGLTPGSFSGERDDDRSEAFETA